MVLIPGAYRPSHLCCETKQTRSAFCKREPDNKKNTMEKTTETSFADVIINGLKKAVVELEEFRVQVALGKAEARDAYEEAKKNFRKVMQDAEQWFATSTEDLTEAGTGLKAILETLQVQLALGKADTRDEFEAQRKKIMQSIHNLETAIEKNAFSREYYEKVHTEIAKFKIKLEIIRLHWELDKMEAREDFELRKKEFARKMEIIASSLREKEKQATNKWKHFREEITEAYQDMKKAFTV